MPQTNQVEASKSSHTALSQSDKVVETSKDSKDSGSLLWLLLVGLALIGVGIAAPASFLSHFTVFVPLLCRLASHLERECSHTTECHQCD